MRARRGQIEGRKDERGERRSPRANGGYVDQRERGDDATANESERASERDATRKDGTKNGGTVGGLGEGNFVDATFPAGERRSLTGHRTERASARWTETFSKVTGSGSDHALRHTCSREAAK